MPNPLSPSALQLQNYYQILQEKDADIDFLSQKLIEVENKFSSAMQILEQKDNKIAEDANHIVNLSKILAQQTAIYQKWMEDRNEDLNQSSATNEQLKEKLQEAIKPFSIPVGFLIGSVGAAIGSSLDNTLHAEIFSFVYCLINAFYLKNEILFSKSGAAIISTATTSAALIILLLKNIKDANYSAELQIALSLLAILGPNAVVTTALFPKEVKNFFSSIPQYCHNFFAKPPRRESVSETTALLSQDAESPNEEIISNRI